MFVSGHPRRSPLSFAQDLRDHNLIYQVWWAGVFKGILRAQAKGTRGAHATTPNNSWRVTFKCKPPPQWTMNIFGMFIPHAKWEVLRSHGDANWRMTVTLTLCGVKAISTFALRGKYERSFTDGFVGWGIVWNKCKGLIAPFVSPSQNSLSLSVSLAMSFFLFFILKTESAFSYS